MIIAETIIATNTPVITFDQGLSLLVKFELLLDACIAVMIVVSANRNMNLLNLILNILIPISNSK